MSLMTREKIIENLVDAGCESTAICAYLQAIESGNRKLAMDLTEAHRDKLLGQYH